MSLSARAIALQGFGFTPIALAVQGLIALLQEEYQQQSQVYGSGKGARKVSELPAPAKLGPTRDEVEQAWDLLETRLRNQAGKAAPVVAPLPAPAPKTEAPPVADIALTPPAQAHATAQVAAPAPDQVETAQQIARRQANDEALLLILLEAC